MNANRWNLQNKVALVTGGTKGIGKAIAEELMGLGAAVFVTARGQEALDICLADWEAKGWHAMGLPTDISESDDRDYLVGAVEEAWGKLDILVNNVGTNARKAAVEYTQAEIGQIFETNFFAAFDFCRQLKPLLAKAAPASVVNVGSVAGLSHVQSGAPYGASKAALTQLTRNLAVEWAADGIRVNMVAPWYIRTPLVEPVLSDPDKLGKIVGRTPMSRVGEPEEVSGAVAFLCMEGAGYVTGQCLSVDGGLLVNAYS